MANRIELYGPEAVAAVPWSHLKVSPSERVWLEAFLRDGSNAYIRNVFTRFYLLRLDSWLFPLTVNEAEYENAYVCSPYTHYIRYAREELRHLPVPWLQKPLAGLLTLAGWGLRAGHIDRTVQVNNWLLSTNLYPDWEGAHLPVLTDWLTRTFPTHAVMFRSLNEKTDLHRLQAFQQAGYHWLPSRQAYWVNGRDGHFLRKKDVKNDEALARKTAYQRVSHEQFTLEDIPRMVALYGDLYLEKYSYCNPAFTEAFVRLCLDNHLLTMHGFRDAAGVLQGFVGYFQRNGVMTTPLVGYDRSRPQEEGLYRLLTGCVLRAAGEQKLLFNMSSGAAAFKRSRGAEAAFEYSVVFNRHLPCWRRLPWRILIALASKLAKPLMQRYQL